MTKDHFVSGVIVILAFLAVGFIREYDGKKQLNEADQKFSQLVQQAKKETSDPCGRHHIRLVQPPKGSNRKAVLVIGGRDLFESEIADVALEAREPIPGEHTVRVAITPVAPEFRDIIWIAEDTEACKNGLSEAIKHYAIFGGPDGNYNTPQWPTKK